MKKEIFSVLYIFGGVIAIIVTYLNSGSFYFTAVGCGLVGMALVCFLERENNPGR